ncbi:MAG: bifunctional N-acetylglucosamine-1-phosphate uridyltransferase/glucosamine-1-phosphate acetyltransferase [Roseovarius sp. BRH_c41]|jgi:bifunctional UDP-N-acetylglucosamine pyrophosphorylase/glucosamine-1-phosphate N-acetyltransferase|uniref:bifunctional UDP-N-acetylglucosamine diphosphorylase/glucosamine-1-phosphate N-acetyltransferase GlmU n=1 Tax=Roseovarius sp. BRH_c41 TaxID=1629709 RepID=UPI0005F18CDE|nr:bifunctional UDP-N-acetylglucosamine diphosphorylase/glucosamine-1-phosphate N-acetyltransferase GlmU [Roseovarius sp. BRH_c41]KJS43305.1 MAG: bifunctional N-acetylglucosamine-1-phosphate uridyltransferase/glucosamine-1-phosphate acetyltransferase [Roseovarius sp. BRH_c41]
MATALIILAAGQGTRMNSELPKVLHPIGSAPMLGHAIQAGATLEPDHVIVVAGHGAEAVRAAALEFDETAQIVIQSEQLGTAHAVAQSAPLLANYPGDALVLYGDTPFIQPETLERMQAARSTHDIVVLGFEAADPGRYGRLVTDGDDLLRIVEFKDATEAERARTLCNSGVVLAPAALLFDLIAQVGNANASGEYYLTDIVGLARVRGLSATAVTCEESETMGINSRAELARAEAGFQTRKRAEALETGVTLVAPETVQFAYDTWLGRDCVIEPYVVFGPGVTIETGAHIRAFSHLEGCHVARGAVVGPYARLRPGTELSEHARIGNFVELKNALIGEGAKVNHLSYIGDTRVGDESNIGAGTITCNYDGVSKHETVIGARVFIGSNTMLVAPVTVGDGAMTGSGSVITRDVAPDALAIARARQVDKPGMAAKLFEMLRAKTRSREKGSN